MVREKQLPFRLRFRHTAGIASNEFSARAPRLASSQSARGLQPMLAVLKRRCLFAAERFP
jgi:hypothetical protein